jgi:hypothetical protein
MRLSSEVGERVHALANEMEAIGVPVTVEKLEIETPLEEKLVRGNQLGTRDHLLVDDPDCPDEPAEVRVVWLRNHVVEQSRAFAIKVVEILGRFVTARDFLLGFRGTRPNDVGRHLAARATSSPCFSHTSPTSTHWGQGVVS